MVDLGDQLRMQAAAADSEAELASAMNVALEAYRADGSDSNKAAYREAVQALADSRQLARTGRPMSMLADQATTNDGTVINLKGEM